MNRQQHEVNVKSKILEVSSALFKEKGFRNTTIRQITSAADIRIGTLYYFFKDKEAIFQHLIFEFKDQITEKVNQLVPGDDHRLRFACEMSLQLNAILSDKNTAEMFYIAHNSYTLSRGLLEEDMRKYKMIFQPFNPRFTEEDYFSRALNIKGHIQAIAMEVINGKVINAEVFVPKTIAAQFELFNIPSGLVRTILQKVDAKNIQRKVA